MRYGRRHGRPAGPPPRGVSIHVTAPGRIFSVTALCAARWLRRRLRLRRLTQPDGQARPPSPVAAATDAAACTRLVAAAAALDAGRRLVRRGCTGVGGKEMPGLVRAEWGIRDGRRQQHAGLPIGHRQRRRRGRLWRLRRRRREGPVRPSRRLARARRQPGRHGTSKRDCTSGSWSGPMQRPAGGRELAFQSANGTRSPASGCSPSKVTAALSYLRSMWAAAAAAGSAKA